jgi:hypothetical protein
VNNTSTKIPAYYLIILFILGWFALISQFWLILLSKQASIAETITRYFSFFTILTNIMLAVCATVLLIKPRGKCGNFFSKPSTLTALTVYITIVGITYNAILRFLWQPQGLQWITDELLHLIIPILFLLLWCFFVEKSGLEYKQAFSWLIYPLLYIIYTAIRGAITDHYPYPFTDVTELGYPQVIINSLGLFVAFLGLSLFLIAVGKYLSRNKN